MSMPLLPLAYHSCLASHIVHMTDVFVCFFWYACLQNVKGDQHHERSNVFPGAAA